MIVKYELDMNATAKLTASKKWYDRTLQSSIRKTNHWQI